MNSFYRIIDKIKQAASSEPFNNAVTFGDIADIDLRKQGMFPLAHITINSATITDNLVQQNMTIFFMDLVEVNNAADESFFLGNDNRQDILNTQLALATRVRSEERRVGKECRSHNFTQMNLYSIIKDKEDLYREEFELLGDASCEPFTERFENMLAGWAVTFTINTKTDMTIC